jgi:hypothetical protein
MFSSMGLENILGLIDMINSLPPTSVYNETAFNQVKLTKTDRRHRLSQKHLNDCMVTKIESDSIEEFFPTPAINRWMVCIQIFIVCFSDYTAGIA